MTTLAEAIAAASGNDGNASNVALEDKPKSSGSSEKLAQSLNDDPSKLADLKPKQVTALNDWLNSNPDFPAAGSIRANVSTLAGS